MNLIVTGRHLTVSASTRALIDKKLATLDRLLNSNAVSGQCVLSRERDAFVCELTVHARGDHMLVATARDARIAPAVSAAVEKVVHQAKKLIDKWKTKKREKVRPRLDQEIPADLPATAAALERPVEPPKIRIIRSRHAIKPMSIDDAVLALSSGEQNVVVFRRADSERLAVIFRRPDGHIGLIEPEA